jgi:hypothetical protein
MLVYDRDSESPSEPIRVSGPDDEVISPVISPGFFSRFAGH